MSLVVGEAATDERYAEAWRAAEWLISPDPHCRRKGIDLLIADEALAYSPLVAHLLASRLDEPDLELRGRIVTGLAHIYTEQREAQPRWRPGFDYMVAWLAAFERGQVERLLEAAAGEAEVKTSVMALLDRVPNLGGTLTRIAADRAVALATRSAAATALGELGVVEALPALQGLKTRIEGQSAGQLAMAFAPRVDPGEAKLLEDLKAAIEMLLDNE